MAAPPSRAEIDEAILAFVIANPLKDDDAVWKGVCGLQGGMWVEELVRHDEDVWVPHALKRAREAALGDDADRQRQRKVKASAASVQKKRDIAEQAKELLGDSLRHLP